MNGFEVGEVGYGFNDDLGFYSYTRTDCTYSMENLFKTKKEAIINEMKITMEWLIELNETLLKELKVIE